MGQGLRGALRLLQLFLPPLIPRTVPFAAIAGAAAGEGRAGGGGAEVAAAAGEGRAGGGGAEVAAAAGGGRARRDEVAIDIGTDTGDDASKNETKAKNNILK
jgi:hypothetical protein